MKKKLMVFFCALTLMMTSAAGMLVGCGKEEETKMTPVVLNEVAHSLECADKGNIERY